MIKTQIQIPDALYREVKRIARERELSFAEVVRRGIESIISAYPTPTLPKGEWQLPKPERLGWKGLSAETLRDLATETSTEFNIRIKKQRHGLH